MDARDDPHQPQHRHQDDQCQSAEETRGGQRVQDPGAVGSIVSETISIVRADLLDVVEHQRRALAEPPPLARTEQQVQLRRRFFLVESRVAFDLIGWKLGDRDAERGRNGAPLFVGHKQRKLDTLARRVLPVGADQPDVQLPPRPAIDDSLGQRLGRSRAVVEYDQSDRAADGVVQVDLDGLARRPVRGAEHRLLADLRALGVGHRDQRPFGLGRLNVELERCCGIEHAHPGGQRRLQLGGRLGQLRLVGRVGRIRDFQTVVFPGVGHEGKHTQAIDSRLDRSDVPVRVAVFHDFTRQADRSARAIAGDEVDAIFQPGNQLATFGMKNDVDLSDVGGDGFDERFARIAAADLVGRFIVIADKELL